MFWSPNFKLDGTCPDSQNIEDIVHQPKPSNSFPDNKTETNDVEIIALRSKEYPNEPCINVAVSFKRRWAVMPN